MIGLYVRGKDFKFTVEIGWFRGNEFAILNIKLFEFFDGNCTIFGIQIAKFALSINLFEQ